MAAPLPMLPLDSTGKPPVSSPPSQRIAKYSKARVVSAFAMAPRTSSYDPVMSKLLLNLRNVPDDEADDVRAMLDAHGVAFYETRPSMWGVSSGGIWVNDDAAIVEAKRLMAEYQGQRQARARAEYAAAKVAGTAETFWMQLRAEPVRVALTLLAILFLLGLVALPMILLRG